MVEQNKIDMAIVVSIARQYKKMLSMMIIASVILSIGLAYALPERFESTVLLRSKNKSGLSGLASMQSAAISLLGGSSSSQVQTYMELLKSRTVLEPLIADLDKPDEVKQKYTYRDFAKEYIDLKTPKGTDIIEMTVTGKTPQEAQTLAERITDNFLGLLSDLNQNEQSTLAKFLQNRIELAEKDLTESEANLVEFQKKEKIIDLDEQGKSLISALTEYDKKVAELSVQNEVARTKLSSINQELAKQNIAVQTFQITDNPSLEKIRSAIIAKQIELVDLKQRYREEHPLMQEKQRQLEELNQKLKEGVNQAVLAGTTTLNPLHDELVKQKALTEVELAVGAAAQDAVQAEMTKREQEANRLASGSLNYFQLFRKANVAREVYGVLVKSYEQARLQEAMDSMEVQLVDRADLPKKKSWPPRTIIVLVGFIFGCAVAGAYVLYRYYYPAKPAKPDGPMLQLVKE